MRYILELGTQEPSTTISTEWYSEGFYAGYTDKGPNIVKLLKQAYHFPSRQNALNVQDGDERLKKSRIVEVL